MFVELCWKKKGIKGGVSYVKKNLTVKEAMKIFEEKMKNDDEYILVYTRKFSNYYYYIHKKLKGFNRGD